MNCSQATNFNDATRFLEDFALRSINQILANFDNPTRIFPTSLGATNHQYFVILVRYKARNRN